MTSYGLICPFLTENPVYAFGVEFGMLYARMHTDESVIEDYFCRENQDQILLLASRLRWRVASMKTWGRDWVRLRLEKESPAEYI